MKMGLFYFIFVSYNNEMKRDAMLYATSKEFDVANISELLTVANPEYVQKVRFGRFGFGELPPEELCLITEHKGTFCIPRNMPQHAGEFFYGTPRIQNENTKGYRAFADYTFTGVLRDYQQSFVRTIPFSIHDDVTILMPCGTGKTIVGAYVTVKRGVRTLILVPTRSIAAQWLAAFRDFTSLGNNTFVATPEKLSKIDLDACEVMIMSFDLFGERLDCFTEDFFAQWGHVILDEAHRVAAPTYQPILSSINCQYRTALTATFRRSDNMHNILLYHFGKKFELDYVAQKAQLVPVPTGTTCSYIFSLKKILGGKKNQERNIQWLFEYFDNEGIEYRHKTKDIVEFDLVVALVTIDKYVVKANRNELSEKEEKYYLEVHRIIKDIKRLNETSVMSLVDTAMSMELARNRMLLQIVRECLDNGRCVLFISKRKEPLIRYNKMFESLGYKSGLITSETQKKDEYMKYVREEAQVCWGIYQITKEGLDIPRADTLILHHPVKDAEQPFGRITRLMEGKQIPMVIWPLDSYKPYQMMFHAMKKICKKIIDVQPVTPKKYLFQLLRKK